MPPTTTTINARKIQLMPIVGSTPQNGPNNTGLNDAVFTAYAPYDNPQIAVGVIIQGGGYGATAAAPIADQVIKAYLASLGK